MKNMGLAGVRRGKKVLTTVSRKETAAGDRVNRQFVAERPDQLWVADFTYVSTWQGLRTWRSSSMCSPGVSWAGGCPVDCFAVIAQTLPHGITTKASCGLRATLPVVAAVRQYPSSGNTLSNSKHQVR